MKIFFVCCLLYVVSCFPFAQQNTFNKENELQKFVERGGKVEVTSPNIYKLIYRDSTNRVFNFNTIPKQSDFTPDFVDIFRRVEKG